MMNPLRKSFLLPSLLAATVALSAPAHAEPDAAANWTKHCATCHGTDGKGATTMGKKLKIKDLTDAAFQASFTDEAAFKAVREGIKTEEGKTTMKAIPSLTDEEINALVALVRTLKQ